MGSLCRANAGLPLGRSVFITNLDRCKTIIPKNGYPIGIRNPSNPGVGNAVHTVHLSLTAEFSRVRHCASLPIVDLLCVLLTIRLIRLARNRKKVQSRQLGVKP